jgi:hypothetical protein
MHLARRYVSSIGMVSHAIQKHPQLYNTCASSQVFFNLGQ